VDEAEFARTAVRPGVRSDDAEIVTNHRPGEAATRLTMRLLATGVPLALLLDLACPLGPDSARIAETERTAAA
jgi:hypothetical protein